MLNSVLISNLTKQDKNPANWSDFFVVCYMFVLIFCHIFSLSINCAFRVWIFSGFLHIEYDILLDNLWTQGYSIGAFRVIKESEKHRNLRCLTDL